MLRAIDLSSDAAVQILREAFVFLPFVSLLLLFLPFTASSAFAQTPTLDQLARDNVLQKMRLRSGGALTTTAPGAASANSRTASEVASPPAGPQRLLAVYGVESSLAAEIDFGSSIARMSSSKPGPIAGWTLASIAPTHVVLVRHTARGDEHRLLAMGAGTDAGAASNKGIAGSIAAGSAAPSAPLPPLLPLLPAQPTPPLAARVPTR